MSKTKLLILSAFVALASLPALAFENVDFTRAAEATVNGVVSIKSYATPRTVQTFNPFESDPFFEYFFGQSPNRQQQQRKQESKPEMRQSGLGSGVIIAADGYIVTNNHVINGAEKLEVTLNDNRTFEAKVIGSDADTDLALIKIDASDLHVIPMGDSDNLKVGEWVLAVGNPFGLTSTVTAGIVSAKARSISGSVGGSATNGIESYIQTDAAVNPGNSGGALVNLQGQLVGINSAIYSQTGNYAGNSFAIPTAIVVKVVDDLKNYGSVQRAVLGITYGELTPELIKEKNIKDVVSGLYVHSVEKGSAADDGGIREGDVIVFINGHAISNTGTLQAEMTRMRPGDQAEIGVKRDGKPVQLTVTMRNRRGNTDITHGTDVKSLGCSFKELTPDTLKQLNISSGLEVVDVTEGKFRDAGIRNGLIILDINNVQVKSTAEVEKLYKSIMDSTEYDHVMFITGTYPNTNRRVYYAVGLD